MTPERFRELWLDPCPREGESGEHEFTKGMIGICSAPHFLYCKFCKCTQKEIELTREALTAFIESEAMWEKAEHDQSAFCSHPKVNAGDEFPHGICLDWTDADWIKASWERYLGRMP